MSREFCCSVIPRMSGTIAKTIEILYKSSMQEVLERIKVLVLLP